MLTLARLKSPVYPMECCNVWLASNESRNLLQNDKISGANKFSRNLDASWTKTAYLCVYIAVSEGTRGNGKVVSSCLFVFSLRRNRSRRVEISVPSEEYFWMAATSVCDAYNKSVGRPNVVQVPYSLMYFRLLPLSRQTRRISPLASVLDRFATRTIHLCQEKRFLFIQNNDDCTFLRISGNIFVLLLFDSWTG